MYFNKLNKNIQYYIASHILQKSKEFLMIYGFDITDEMEKIAKNHIENHIPLSKIFQTKAFWKHDFFTNENTLDPRPETESIIELFQSHNHTNVTIVEFGVGTGAVLLSIMADNPSIKGIGIDISSAALKVCEYNAKKIDVKPILKCMDLKDFHEPADILISNPPYLTEEEIVENPVLQYDPHIALYGGIDGLDCYRAILEVVKRCNFTHIYLEVPPKRQSIVQEMFKDFNVYIV